MNNPQNRLTLDKYTRQKARLLIEQQMWCWGFDVRRAEGNLLLFYGAQKRPSPNPRYNSKYVFALDNEVTLNIWSWGLWIASPEHGSLFIGRSRFQTYYMRTVIPTPDAWCKKELLRITERHPHNEVDHQHGQFLLATAMRWMGHYEAWIQTQVTPHYREDVLSKWSKRKRHKGGIAPSRMAESWLDLSISHTHELC